MTGYLTIVVAIDGSEASLPAVARAGAPAGAADATPRSGGDVLVVHTTG